LGQLARRYASAIWIGVAVWVFLRLVEFVVQPRPALELSYGWSIAETRNALIVVALTLLGSLGAFSLAAKGINPMVKKARQLSAHSIWTSLANLFRQKMS